MLEENEQPTSKQRTSIDETSKTSSLLAFAQIDVLMSGELPDLSPCLFIRRKCSLFELFLLTSIDSSAFRKSSSSILNTIFESVPASLFKESALYLMGACADCNTDSPLHSLLMHCKTVSMWFDADSTFSLLKGAAKNDSRAVLELLFGNYLVDVRNI
jgi:hypothetical protein